jgi:flagella basal body P-ring formation protein FlgA
MSEGTTSATTIQKGDIVEHKATGQTWRVVANTDGKLRVKGYGMSVTFLLHEVSKAPPRV